MLLLKLFLLLLLFFSCDTFYYKSATILLQSATGITKCGDYYKVSAIEQTLKLKRSSRIREQSGKNRWPRTLRPAKDWRREIQKFIVICRQVFLNMCLGLGPLHQLPIQIFNYVYGNMSRQLFATRFGYHMVNQ